MTPITPELKQAIEQAGDAPARLVDLETNVVYVVLKADLYQTMRDWLDPLAESWGPEVDVYDESVPCGR